MESSGHLKFSPIAWLCTTGLHSVFDHGLMLLLLHKCLSGSGATKGRLGGKEPSELKQWKSYCYH